MNKHFELTETKTPEPRGRMWSTRKIREYATTYEITHAERMDLRAAWTFSRACDHPFNTLLTCKYPSTSSRKDSWVVRHTARRVRVYLRILGVQSHIMWTRFIEPGSGVEQFALLVHIPDENLKHFVTLAHRWNLNSAIQTVDYENCYLHKGITISPLDFLCRAASAESIHKDPTTFVEASDPIVGPRYFHSWKLKKSHRIAHRNAKPVEAE